MSALPKHDAPMTEADYFALLREGEQVKYELIDGSIYAMSGAKPNHGIIETNLVGIFFRDLQDTPCAPRTSNTAVTAEHNYFFPDVTVVCDEPQYVDDAPIGILTNPTLIVEVLSMTTAHKDRTTKFDHYGCLPTLQDYVLVSQDAPRIECYSRGEGESWIFTKAVGLEASIVLPALDVTLALAEVYQRVQFTADDDE